jgi:lipopolysaccharide export LptBFGC system permease protein LptF
MVFTLHRYIFRELAKVFVLAAVALTLMLSIGIILRPVQEFGVGPRQVVHLMGYFLPVTLTFVLPIAALFAASLIYGRLAADNELDACKASGISLLTLVYPGLVLAIIVAIANLILSFHVMPVFVHRAEKSLKADAKQILFRNIQRRGYYKLPPDERYLIYADLADPQNDTLSGVVVVEAEEGQIEKITTAESAKILFYPDKRFNEVQITAHKTYQMGLGSEGSAEWLSLTAEFGSLLGDEIKFKRLAEMKKIRDVDLMLFGPIAKLARRVYAQFTVEVLARDIAARTAGFLQPAGEPLSIPEDTSAFYKLHSGQRIVEFIAGRCDVPDKKEKRVELSEQVVVIEYDAARGQYLRTMRCKKAHLDIEGDELTPTLTMQLYNPTWQNADGREGSAWGWVRIRGLILPQAVEAATNKFRTQTGLKAAELASESLVLRSDPAPKMRDLQEGLQKEIRKTLAEIEAETHSRLVFGVGCLSMILIGIGLGIIFKGGHLLTAFGASCVPAAVLVVGIMMGRNVAKNVGAHAGSGVILMWAGFIFLSFLAVLIYRRLLKN